MLRRPRQEDYAINDGGRRLPKRVEVQSGDAWLGLGLQAWETQGEEMGETVLPFDVIAVNHGIRTSEVHWTGSRPVSGRTATGLIGVLPKDIPYSVRAWGPARCTAVGVQRELLGHLAGGALPTGFELMPAYGVEDPFLQGCCDALAADARQGHPLGAMYGETLGAALVAHLISRYANRPHRPSVACGGTLPRRDFIRQYIHDRLGDKLSLADMAAAVQMDMYSFARWFKRNFGTPPHQYVLAARIDRARGMLLRSGEPLVTIALRCGFSSQSHFSAVFARAVGTSPGDYRARVR